MKQEEKFKDDERIRKALITFFNRFPYDSIEAAGTNAKEAIAWLEHKPIELSDEHIKVLDEVIKNPYLSTDEYNGLIALREQFKAL